MGSPGGGGRSTTASSGASTTTTRLPERSGSRVTGLGNRPVEPEEARAEAAARPEARGEQVRHAPVGQHHAVALLGGPGEPGLRERDADPTAAGLGNGCGEAQGARVLGAGEATMLGRALGGDEGPARDRPAVAEADQDRLLVVGERPLPLLAASRPATTKSPRTRARRAGGRAARRRRRSAPRSRPLAGRGSRSPPGSRPPCSPAPPGSRAPAAARSRVATTRRAARRREPGRGRCGACCPPRPRAPAASA